MYHNMQVYWRVPNVLRLNTMRMLASIDDFFDKEGILPPTRARLLEMGLSRVEDIAVLNDDVFLRLQLCVCIARFSHMRCRFNACLNAR